MEATKPRAALVASPGMGHLSPVLELARRLVTYHGVRHATIFVVTTDESLSQSKLGNLSLVRALKTVILPPVNVSCLADPTVSLLRKLVVTMREAIPTVQSAIMAMESFPDILIVDMFGTEVLSAVEENQGIRKYALVTTSAWFLSLTLYLPCLDRKALHNHVLKQEPILIPGCHPVRLDPPVQGQSEQDLIAFLGMGAALSMVDGVLVNTWQDLEPSTLESFVDGEKLGRFVRVPIHPVGPLVRPPDVEAENRVLDWLNLQPKDSVMYVSFGSGGSLSAEQTIELAFGLEKSQQRFVWVVRPPKEMGSARADGRNDSEESPALDFLPSGFLGRTYNKGLVVPMWAPQTTLLAHPSVGGFLTHSGWNSTLESLVNRVPMIAWPLYAEQKMNALMLSEELKVAIRPPSDCLVTGEEIAKMVKKILVEQEGSELRDKAKELGNTAHKALSENGSSYNSLSKLTKS